MRVFLDTSVLVAAVVLKHESHPRAFPLLERVQNGKDEGFVAAHSLAEMYAILTSLAGNDYASLIREAAVVGIQGGTIYNAVLLKSAEKSNPERVFTLNLKHFLAVAPRNLGPKLSAP